MQPAMLEALYRISILTSPDPEEVFRQIAEVVAEMYGNTMAMVNVQEGNCLRYRTIVNPHPAFQRGDRVKMRHSLCQFSMHSVQPLLIQNACENPRFCRHIVVSLHLNRYLGVPICTPEGSVVGTLCFMDDRTEELLGEEDIRFLSLLAMRVSAELAREALLESRLALQAEQHRAKMEHLVEASRFKAFIDSTADGVLSFDTEGRTTCWNGGAERIFGYTAQEVIGAPFALLDLPADLTRHPEAAEVLDRSAHQCYDTRCRHKDGSLVDVSITTSPLIVDGVVTGQVAIVRDITERVRATEELCERNAQLDTLAQEQRMVAGQLADLNAQLQTRAEEKRNFVNMVIHDLRHPLTAIRTTLHLLRLTRDKKQRAEDLKALENRTRALNTLLDELVLYDQIEAGRAQLHLEEIEVGPFLLSCVEEVAGHADAQAVPVRCEISPDLGAVSLDRRKLRHILLNLVSNALKFTQEGQVTVRACPEDADQWRLEVEDTGMGMTSAVRERAFEEYFSGASGAQDGIGLGLAIAHRLATALQARMTLRSRPGQGTVFLLVFPRRPAASEASAGVARRSSVETEPRVAV